MTRVNRILEGIAKTQTMHIAAVWNDAYLEKQLKSLKPHHNTPSVPKYLTSLTFLNMLTVRLIKKNISNY